MGDRVVLTVPAQRAYLLVIRTALGGLALVHELDVDTLDDLRQAADEACDCLMHQSVPAARLRLETRDAGAQLQVTLAAELPPAPGARQGAEIEISRAVLETLVAQVEVCVRADGLVERIELTVPKARV